MTPVRSLYSRSLKATHNRRRQQQQASSSEYNAAMDWYSSFVVATPSHQHDHHHGDGVNGDNSDSNINWLLNSPHHGLSVPFSD